MMENGNPAFNRLLEEIKSGRLKIVAGPDGPTLIVGEPKTNSTSQPSRNMPLPRPATPPHPPCPPRLTQRTLMGADGGLYRQIPGMGGKWRPVNTIGGIQARATTVGGFPALPPTIGPRQPARMFPGGPPVTGPGGQPLFGGGPPSPFMPR